MPSSLRLWRALAPTALSLGLPFVGCGSSHGTTVQGTLGADPLDASACFPLAVRPAADGTAPCLVIDAKMPRPAAAGQPDPFSPSQIADCNQCTDPAREPLSTAAHPIDASSLAGDVAAYRCKCAVVQYGQDTSRTTAADLAECQTHRDSPTVSGGGWCYVDPSVAPNDTLAAAEADVVSDCPSGDKRKIRFVAAGVETATLFVACIGVTTGDRLAVTCRRCAWASPLSRTYASRHRSRTEDFP